MNEYVIRKLKEGRNHAKLKQSEVAAKLGLKGNTLSNYENGVSEPDIDTFCALCEIYNLDPSYILGEAYGLNVQGSDFNVKMSEIEHIKKYRALDLHGKEMVDFTLQKEWERSTEENRPDNIISIVKEPEPNYLAPNAAHERTDKEFTAEERVEDDSMLD